MLNSVIILVIITLLSAIAKDFALTIASAIVMAMVLSKATSLTDIIQKPIFNIGLFCLMLFILMPLAKGKLDFVALGKDLISWKGLLVIVIGFLISYIGGKGVGILAAQPMILVGVMVGTLLAVLLAGGLPAGLIISAGIIALLSKAIQF